MRTRASDTMGMVLGAVLLAAAAAQAGTLADQLREEGVRSAQSQGIAGVIGGRVVVDELVRTMIAASAGYTPALSPAFTYTWDSAGGEVERSSDGLGTLFSERPETAGAGRFSLGMLYLYTDFTELDGRELDGGSTSVRGSTGAGIPYRSRMEFDDFTFTSHTWSFWLTYGLTNDWDVGLLLPLVYTELDVDGRMRPGVRYAVDDSKFGVGDLQLRTKFRLPQSGCPLKSAVGLNVRTPTGEEENFHGLGDVVVTPYLVFSYTLEAFDFHASIGFDANASDFARSRVRYTAGSTVQVGEHVALVFDFLGDSGTEDDELGGPGTIDRTDLIAAAPGLRLAVGEGLNAHLGAIVPLTHDGLTADVIPTGAIEYTF